VNPCRLPALRIRFPGWPSIPPVLGIVRDMRSSWAVFKPTDQSLKIIQNGERGDARGGRARWISVLDPNYRPCIKHRTIKYGFIKGTRPDNRTPYPYPRACPACSQSWEARLVFFGWVCIVHSLKERTFPAVNLSYGTGDFYSGSEYGCTGTGTMFRSIKFLGNR
jgi:hypothetical protein